MAVFLAAMAALAVRESSTDQNIVQVANGVIAIAIMHTITGRSVAN